MADINEKFCIAMDEIVSSRINGLEFDITKVCTITDTTDAAQGKYIVTDGNIKFEAYSDITNYRKSNSVYVTIPKGDWNQQKIIIGKYTETNSTPFVYTSPLDTMISFEDFSITSAQSNLELTANLGENFPNVDSNEKIVSSGSLPAGYTRIGLSANFRTWLSAWEPSSGTYGLKLILWTESDKTINDETSRYQFYELVLDNINDMYGAPYNFEDYFLQEKVFDISAITNVNGFNYQLSFFQNGDFKDIDENDILPYEEFENQKTQLPSNIFVKDIKIDIGYDVENFSEEQLILYTTSTSTYTNKENDATANQKIINLRWIHKDSDSGKFKVVTLEDLNKTDPELMVKWYYYEYGAKAVDEYSKQNWVAIPNDYATLINQLSCKLSPNIQDAEQKIKAVGLCKITDKDGNITYQPYYSQPTTFENESEVANKESYRVATALSIECQDGSLGNYYIYNQNNELLDKGIGPGYQRKFKVLFEGADLYGINNGLNKDKYTVDSITWLIPTSNTMIGLDKEYYNDVSSDQISDTYEYRNKTYKSITRKYSDLLNINDNTLNLCQSYYIKDYWSANNSNNTVFCILSKDKVEYVAELELNFGIAGTNGSDVTFILQLYDESGNRINALDLETNKIGVVKALLYDINGQEISIEDKTINWSWYSKNDDYLMFFDDSITGSTNTINLYAEEMFNNNYYIIQARLKNWIQKVITIDENGEEVEETKADFDLIAYLPIAVKLNTNYLSLSGAKEVVYNTLGTPEYSKNAYKIYNINNEKIDCVFHLKTEEVAQYAPSLVTDKNNNIILSANSFYIDGANKQVCVYAIEDGQIVWSQPLLFYRNAYEFSMLNEWDGSLTLDDNSGTILSTMIGAGSKDNENKFSGVLIGDIQKGTDNDLIKQTGVYGFSGGVNTFALKEDGTATFGAYDKGQIQIDGNGGTIQSANWTENSAGLILDLDDGILDTRSALNSNNKYAEVLIQPTATNDKGYFYIQSADGNPLINIEEDNYFLQSNNYKSSASSGQAYSVGTKLDLDDGTIFVGAKQGSVTIDSSDPFFVVQSNHYSGDSYIDSSNLIYIGQQEYYLESDKYNTKQIKNVTYSGVVYYLYYYNGNYYLISSKDNTIYSSNYQGDLGSEVTFSESSVKGQNGFVDHECGSWSWSGYTVTEEQNKNKFIAKLEPVFDYNSQGTGKGLHIDLQSGFITGYDFCLQGASSSDSSHMFIIDTTSPSTPLQIGNKFKVGWDGTLTCDNIVYLGTQPQTGNYVININENFKVDSNGNASCNGLSIGGNYVGSTSIPTDYSLSNSFSSFTAVSVQRGYISSEGKIQVQGHIKDKNGNFLTDYDLWIPGFYYVEGSYLQNSNLSATRSATALSI